MKFILWVIVWNVLNLAEKTLEFGYPYHKAKETDDSKYSKELQCVVGIINYALFFVIYFLFID